MDLFKTTLQVSIELSNMCNYSHIHKKCPASTRTTKEILPAFVVYDILKVLGKCDYDQSIAFYNYSDSLNDPRLFSFIEYASSTCSKANIVVGTNGWYLTEVMVKELYEAGATFIIITAYSKSELERFKEIKKNVAPHHKGKSLFVRARLSSLDDRMEMVGKGGKCGAPLTNILVTSNGKTALCCLDINRKYSYGDVSVDGFEAVMIANYQYLKDSRDELMEGKRNIELCKECGFRLWLTGCKHGEDVRPKRRLL